MSTISGTTERSDGVDAVRVGVYASALRCLLTYVVAPALAIALPAAGAAVGSIAGALQALGAAVATAGCVILWQTRHRARVPYTVVTAAVLALALYPLIAALGGGR